MYRSWVKIYLEYFNCNFEKQNIQGQKSKKQQHLMDECVQEQKKNNYDKFKVKMYNNCRT